MSEDEELSPPASQDAQVDEIPSVPVGTFTPPSVSRENILAGVTHTHYSPLPEILKNDPSTECVLGVDEAGRGPVLGPMVYGIFYLPVAAEQSLLKEKHNFMDSKMLNPTVRSKLMQLLCTPGTLLFSGCGWATSALAARAISAAMLRAGAPYNLNAQAMDATVELIQGVIARGVNVKSIFVDTIGAPATYQRKLEALFPQCRVTVAKKADALYPCVSAASVAAKVTRDAALEACYEAYIGAAAEGGAAEQVAGWGSGYPSDARCVTWLKRNMDPVFGWGSECRFSWGTAKDMLEARGAPCRIEWADDQGDDEDDDAMKSMKMTTFFTSNREGDEDTSKGEIGDWFGKTVPEAVF